MLKFFALQKTVFKMNWKSLADVLCKIDGKTVFLSKCIQLISSIVHGHQFHEKIISFVVYAFHIIDYSQCTSDGEFVLQIYAYLSRKSLMY